MSTSFYFIRHGQTDWNKNRQDLCCHDEIPLNETGLLQAISVRRHLTDVRITHLYSSPLLRAQQTAEIINEYLKLPLILHQGLRTITDLEVLLTCQEIVQPDHITLMVSHGELYRVLLRILDIQTNDLNAKNGGLYFFKAPDEESTHWAVHRLSDDD